MSLLNKKIGFYSLDDQIKDALLTPPHSHLSPYLNFNDFLYESLKINSFLPNALIKMISDFKNRHSSHSAMLIKNLPVDKDLSPTPLSTQAVENKSSFLSEMMLLAIGQQLGEVFSYIEEKSGQLIHSITPQREGETSRSNAGSVYDFHLHTELAFFEYRPDYLLLLCLRSNKDNRTGFTTLACIEDAVEKLDQSTLDILKKPLFRIGIPESFGKNKVSTEPVSVISHHIHDPELRVNFNNMQAITEEGKEALKKLEEALNSSLCKLLLEPGDLLIVDNKKSAHGRTAFSATYDGNDRWLQRVYIKSTLREMKHLSYAGRVHSYANYSHSHHT
ncbi:MAG: TauD/TfdA family dioxygenase [Gammaproteobacteria bacterium]|nr:TauD/TfdA family dioxygenase [Gammaproteobacteria bacterium]